MADKRKSQPLHEIIFSRPLGAPVKFKTPEALAEKCAEYLQWAHDNPLESPDGKIKKVQLVSIRGLCLYIGIAEETWYNWRKTREDLSESIGAVEKAIVDWQLKHASADLINANIVARLLGLTEKREVTGGVTINMVTEFVEDDDG